jgi:hypothetical protein
MQGAAYSASEFRDAIAELTVKLGRIELTTELLLERVWPEAAARLREYGRKAAD